MPELPLDLRELVTEVAAQAPRLLALQDRDPDSPNRGCMHLAFWRDKTSDIADIRRQEAALAFAWLWKHDLPGNTWRGERELLHAAQRAMRFWAVSQHSDGTFDEWYKGEHGYAVTAFSSYAISLTLMTLEETLSDELRRQVLAGLRRCGDWLRSHHDFFKTNHEAVGVAALSAISRAVDDRSYADAATENAAQIAERQHPEGWSREIAGLDLGYSFLLAEYTAMHAVLTGEQSVIEPAAKAYRFAVNFLHPDLTTGAEYGICGNPYFSRVATAILAPHDARAAGVLRYMDRPIPGPRETATLKDDLRLSRYAYQPLLAALLVSGGFDRQDAAATMIKPVATPFERKEGEQWFAGAKLLSAARPSYAAWAAPCHGGLVRVAFRRGEAFLPNVVDRGYVIEAGDETLRNARYDLKVDATWTQAESELAATAPLAPCRFVMPPYWARVGLRVATATPYGPKWSRWMIDQYRKRKGTALNQSAAGVSGGRAKYMLRRRIRLEPDAVVIQDELTSNDAAISLESLHMVMDGPVRLPDGTRPDMDRRLPVTRFVAEQAERKVILARRLRCVGEYVVVEPTQGAGAEQAAESAAAGEP